MEENGQAIQEVLPQPSQEIPETSHKKPKRKNLFIACIILVILLLIVGVGVFLKSQGKLHYLIPGNSHDDPVMQALGCNSQQSCMQACSKPENQSKCQQLFQQFGQKGNQNGSQGQGNTQDFAMAGNNGNTSTASLPTCQGSAFFDHFPTDTNAYTGVEPLGHMNGQHVLPDQADHVYINLVLGPNGNGQLTNVYAPGNVTLLQVMKKSDYIGSYGNVTDYLIEFSPCRSVIFTYDHIQNLSSKIVNALNGQTPTCQQGGVHQSCTYANLSVQLQSGEKIGTAGGGGALLAFDFGGADVRTNPLAFIDTSPSVQTGVTGNSYLHAICPLDYFTSTPKNVLYGKLTIKNAGANGIPACGITMQDKAGTLQGNWYHQGSSQPYQGLNIQGSLAIVHSNLDPTKGEISAGTDLLPSSDLGAQMLFTPQNSGYINREPSQIMPDGHVYCFDGPEGAGGSGNEGHVDMQLTNATTLQVDYGSGACPVNPTLSSPLIYTR